MHNFFANRVFPEIQILFGCHVNCWHALERQSTELLRNNSETTSASVKSDQSLLCALSSRKHLRTKVTADFHLTYSKSGENLVGIKMIKMDNFQYYSIKSCCGCVLESPHRGDSNTHPKHDLWRNIENLGKNTGLL